SLRERRGIHPQAAIGNCRFKGHLENNLQKKIRFLCWPGGAHTMEAHELAMESGFLATTKGDRENTFGNDPTRLHRTAAYLDSHKYNRTFLKMVSLPLFALEVQSYRGSPIANLVMRSAAKAVRTSRAMIHLSKRSHRSAGDAHLAAANHP